MRSLLLFLFAACPLLAEASAPTASDPVRDLEAAYVAAWISNDSAAVMATISRDAVIIPSRMKPIRGIEAIRAFWFPDDGSTTTVTSYQTRIEASRIDGSIGWAWGTGDLSFTWEKDGQRTSASQTSTFTMIAMREADGTWRIVHRMWTDR